MIRELLMVATLTGGAGTHSLPTGGEAPVDCHRLRDLTIVSPSPVEDIEDPVYAQLRMAGYAAIPCLIESVLDDHPMNPPENLAGRGPTTVGEVALRVAEDIVGPALRELMVDGGSDEALSALFRTRRGRHRLRAQLRTWYLQEQAKNLSAIRLASTERARRVCERLHALRSMPLRDGPVTDPLYRELVSLGDEAIPCLIDKVMDLRLMRDPRSIPSGRTTIGDVALFVITRTSSKDGAWEAAVPERVQRKIEEDGYYALLDYSSVVANRRAMYERLQGWYQRTFGGQGGFQR